MRSIVTILFTFYATFIHAQTYQWQPVGEGVRCNDIAIGQPPKVPCFIRSMVVDSVKNILYVSGDFDSVGRYSTFNGGYWDGNDWTPVIDLGGNDMLMYNGYLINAGNEGIGMWDGDTNKMIGYVVDHGSLIKCLTIYNGDLIVGGEFRGIGWVDSSNKHHAISANNIARWDGTWWYPLGGGVTGASSSPDIKCMEVYKGELYVGGDFQNSGTVEIHGIGKWDGAQWKQAGGVGVNQTSGNFYGALVTKMIVYKDKLYIGGWFDSICGIYTPGFAILEDSIWKEAPIVLQGAFPWFLTAKDSLYSSGGGTLYNISNDSLINKRAKLSTFTKYSANAMVEYQNQIYIAGGFTEINSIPYNRIARKIDVTGISEPDKKQGLKLYPNPVTDQLTVTGYSHQEASMEVKDLLGRTLQTQKLQPGSTVVPVASLTPGGYLLQVRDKEGISISKFVKE